MDKTIAIDIPIYNTDLVVHFGASETLYSWLKEHTEVRNIHSLLAEVEANDQARGLTIWDDSGALLVWMAKYPDTPELMGVLVHELLHATSRVLRRAGVAPSDETEEAYTYLLEYITEAVVRELGALTSTS